MNDDDSINAQRWEERTGFDPGEYRQWQRQNGELMDFTLENHGSICILRPHTPEAIEWVEEYIGEDNGYQPQWPAVLIEPRYVEAILAGIAEAGLEVEV